MIGYLAPNDGNVPLEHTLTGRSIMANSGSNTGNLAFFYMGCRLVEGDITFLTHSDPRVKLCDAVIVPAANWIGGHTDIAFLAKALADVTCPILVLGLGAQSENEDQIPEIPDGTKAFLKLLNKKGARVGVRGEYSAKVLEHYGLKNFRVVGCPSLLTSSDKNLGRTMEEKIGRLSIENILIAAACIKGKLQSVERELFRMALYRRGSSYVVQRPSEFISVLTRQTLTPEEDAYLRMTASFLGLSGGKAELVAFLLEVGHVPVGVEGWSAHAQRFSCAINTRIHGTMVPFQAGVPSLCITHDTRTKELAERCKLPRITIAQFTENRHRLKTMFGSAQFDGAAFDENRTAVAQDYVAMLAEIGLMPSRHLQALAN
ncbi:MAG: hypothetical protein DI629_14250 [Mesorhizobium amorphae]|nr:MAG: hypothetical protein DI629_14250 [Mesorhizobium amorphae]